MKNLMHWLKIVAVASTSAILSAAMYLKKSPLPDINCEARFLTHLEKDQLTDDIFALIAPLAYESDLLDCTIIVPVGFQSDGSSVPRVPIAYMFFGDRAHHESVIHDFLYRIDSEPIVPLKIANDVFLEAMLARGKSSWIAYAMWLGVCMGGWASYHKRRVGDKLTG